MEYNSIDLKQKIPISFDRGSCVFRYVGGNTVANNTSGLTMDIQGLGKFVIISQSI